jgi:hypothetical protein
MEPGTKNDCAGEDQEQVAGLDWEWMSPASSKKTSCAFNTFMQSLASASSLPGILQSGKSHNSAETQQRSKIYARSTFCPLRENYRLYGYTRTETSMQQTISKHVPVWERIEIFIMDLEETKARNDCAGEGQQQFNRPTGNVSWSRGFGSRQSPDGNDVRRRGHC